MWTYAKKKDGDHSFTKYIWIKLAWFPCFHLVPFSDFIWLFLFFFLLLKCKVQVSMFLVLGFHEALSEAISLSVSNPKHMQTLGLVLTSVDDVPHNINFLFHLAMDKLTFLPFSLALDMWRWDIFSGFTRKERYNCHWWDLRYTKANNVCVFGAQFYVDPYLCSSILRASLISWFIIAGSVSAEWSPQYWDRK